MTYGSDEGGEQSVDENVAVSSNRRSEVSVNGAGQTVVSVLGLGQRPRTEVQGLRSNSIMLLISRGNSRYGGIRETERGFQRSR